MRDSVQLKDTGLMNYDSEAIAFAMAAVASEMNVAYALWKLPKSTQLSVLIDFSVSVTKKKPQLEKSEQGFVIQPFLQSTNEEAIFLKADILYSTSNKDISVKAEQENPIRKEEFLKKVSEKLKSGEDKILLPLSVKNYFFAKTVEQYTELVLQAREAIQENRFKKVVLARSKEINISDELNIGSVFQKISAEYPNAFVSLVYTKETGAWLTATPEILASIDKNGTFRTIALAGTQELKPGDSPQKAVWTQKEIEEQALVCRYIIGCFKKIRLREYDENGPRTVQSGNLLHLRTDFAVNTVELNFPELGTVMLELLHPTSAVCGMPKEVTLEFIKEHENLERKLFSGYLGPVNINAESHIFVNLRCANLFADKVVLYAGAGITQDSEPEKEYQETELKMEAVGRFFAS
jgi:isochorismate synthase